MTMRYLTAGEAARLLGVAPSTLRDYGRRNKLNAQKVDASTNLYDEEEVAALKADPPRRTGRPRTLRETPDAPDRADA